MRVLTQQYPLPLERIDQLVRDTLHNNPAWNLDTLRLIPGVLRVSASHDESVIRLYTATGRRFLVRRDT